MEQSRQEVETGRLAVSEAVRRQAAVVERLMLQPGSPASRIAGKNSYPRERLLRSWYISARYSPFFLFLFSLPTVPGL